RAHRAARGRGCRAVPLTGRCARLLALDPAEEHREAAAAEPRAGAASTPARTVGRVHRRADRLRAGRVRAGLRERDPSGALERHARESPRAARARRPAVLPIRRDVDPAPLRSPVAARRPRALPAQEVPPAAGLRRRAVRSVPVEMKVLLVTMYFPPAGGGGVQRPLKTATHLPALGIETHVLAPDDPKWLHRDDELRPPTQAFVHRARYFGPRARLLAQARLAYRRALLPDASVTWLPTAVPVAVRLVKREGIDAVITTSPPVSMNLIGAAVKRLTGIPWVADLRDAVLWNADRRFDRAAVQAKEKALEG